MPRSTRSSASERKRNRRKRDDSPSVEDLVAEAAANVETADGGDDLLLRIGEVA